MGANMQGIQPSILTPEELVRYAYLKNVNGLPKDWCDVLISTLHTLLDERQDYINITTNT